MSAWPAIKHMVTKTEDIFKIFFTPEKINLKNTSSWDE